MLVVVLSIRRIFLFQSNRYMIDSWINSAKWHDESPWLSDILPLVREVRLLTWSNYRELIQLGREAHFRVGVFVNLESHNIRVLFGDYDRTNHEAIKFNRLSEERFYSAEITISDKTLNTCRLVSRYGWIDAVPLEVQEYANKALRAFFNRK